MNVLKISLKNILNKPLYSVLSILSLSFSIALLFGIQQLDALIQEQLNKNIGKVDMVIGAKGSPLQLVLSSVLHLDNPTGNISYAEAKEISRNPMIGKAIPISYGDNYKGYRIVGTTKDFDELYELKLTEGRLVNKSMEVVLGSSVAALAELKIGDSFESSHGLTENSVEVHKHQPLRVVGIYQSTGTVVDQLIITNLQSVWDVHDHSGNENENINDKEITSMLISFRNPMGLLTMPRQINQRTAFQAALPKFELERLFSFTGVGVKTIAVIAYVILVISCLFIFLSLFKMVRERAFDLALMRTYGATNGQLVIIVALEGLLLVLVSLAIGYVLSRLGLFFALSEMQIGNNQNYLMGASFKLLLSSVIPIMIISALAIVLAIIPILKMNVSKILNREI
ncbi:MAG: ABC transporter permease [Bacteroidota bacterium]